MQAEQTTPRWRFAPWPTVLHVRRLARRLVRLTLVFFLMLLLAGAATPSAVTLERAAVSAAANGWRWNLVRWEVAALGQKLAAWWSHPARGLGYEEGVGLVRDYLARAAEIDHLGRELTRLAAAGESPQAQTALQAEIDELAARQSAAAPTVEALLQAQVGDALLQAGLGRRGLLFPPVLFTFDQSPKKLVVSPRERIETIYSAMLDDDMPLSAMRSAEAEIAANTGRSAYVSPTGGLGAYPAIVVDRAPVDWILETVAHEWVHNYLTLYPLGLCYTCSSELTTINETVAEIAGVEIGRAALARFYPTEAAALATAPAAVVQAEAADGAERVDAPPPAMHADAASLADRLRGPEIGFDFNAEMRATRLMVDWLLSTDQVDEAEKYMEARRRIFVRNGYPLRRLNQAYFAFHGSYGVSAASTSPIGPKLERLRSLTPDVPTFLAAVRDITSPGALDDVLAEWEARSAAGGSSG